MGVSSRLSRVDNRPIAEKREGGEKETSTDAIFAECSAVQCRCMRVHLLYRQNGILGANVMGFTYQTNTCHPGASLDLRLSAIDPSPRHHVPS